MATLRDIRNRISGVTSIEKITSAMKMVSSVKSRRTQKQVEAARPYYKNIEKILGALIDSEEITTYDNQLFHSRNEEIKNVAIIIIAGDKGMCGSFNNGLFKTVDAYIKNEFAELYPVATPHLILFGTKTVDYYKKKKNNYNIIAEFPNASHNLNFSIVDALHNTFVDDFLVGDLDRVEIFYNKFVNVMKQVPTKFPLLPIEIGTDLIENETEDSNVDFIFEPNKKVILDKLIDQYLDWNIWGSILESNAAEQAARLIAMDKATQNARDLIKELELQYNNARQAAITTEMLEIVGGAEALKK